MQELTNEQHPPDQLVKQTSSCSVCSGLEGAEAALSPSSYALTVSDTCKQGRIEDDVKREKPEIKR